MRILFLCNKSPWPAHEGGPMAMNSIISGLASEGHFVKVLAVVSDKFMVKEADVPKEYRNQTQIEFDYIDLGIHATDAFFNLFTRKSYHVQRFIAQSYRKKLIRILNEYEFDVVQLETLFMTPYVEVVRKHSNAIVVLRAHNIEHLIWKRMASGTANPLKRLYLHHLASTLQRFEKQAASLFDGIAAITPKDAAFFSPLTPVPVIDLPFGIEPAEWATDTETALWPGLYHIGSMNWMPNEEGIKWFLDEVWPVLKRQFPELSITLAGRFMPSWLVSGYRPGVEVAGEVPDARQFALAHSIAIVPLLSGSGIRIKIIEAMALGKVVITTSIGAEGIQYTDKGNILIADSPVDFVEAVSFCLANPQEAAQIGKAARQLIVEKYSRKTLNNRLLEFYDQLINHREKHS